MFGRLLKFELGLQIKQIGFWITLILMFTLGFLAMSVDWLTISVEGGERVKNNGSITLAAQIAIISLASIFFGAVFVVTGMMRDDVHKSLEVVHSTPVTTFDMNATRMVGVFTATFLCIVAAVFGLFVGQFAPWADKETFGPINPLYFIQPIIVFVIINALFVSALYTAIAAFTRNRTVVYVSAVAILMLYFVGGLLVGQDAPDWLTSLVDPFGANALVVSTEFWPADQQNTSLSPLWGHVGINRLIYGAAALALFAAIFPLFKRGLIGRKVKSVGQKVEEFKGERNLKPAPTSFGFGDTVSAFFARLKFEYLATVKSIAFMILLGIAFVLFTITIAAQLFFVPDPTYPTSLSMASTVIGSFGLTMLLIIVFFSGEIVWRDRTAKIHEIMDATAVRNWPVMLAKWLALVAVIFTLILFGMMIGMIAQMILGDIPVNIMTYLKFGFINVGAGFALMAFLALFIQNFMPNRILGMFAAAGVLIFFIGFVDNLPFYHPLMNYGSLGAGGLSEINGYNDLTRFKWFGTYWSLLAIVFAVISAWLWRRGLQSGLIARFKALPSRLSPASLGIAVVALTGFVFTGVTIFNAYNKVEWRNSKAQELRSVEYEKLFFEISKRPIPKIRAVTADVHFMPSKQEAVVSGTYRIENTTGAPLEEIYVNLPTAHVEDMLKLEIARAERVIEGDNIEKIEDFGYWLYKFDQPLAPGAFTRVEFETFFHAPRLADGSLIRRNGTFVNNFQVMPFMEIEENWLQNPDKRRKYDLPELPKRPDQTDEAGRQVNFITNSADYVDFRARVCTDPGQIPIAPGKLMREETVEIDGEERHCRRYEAINPILNFFSFLSADYTVKQDAWQNPDGDDVDISIYYHEAHDYNVDLMVEAVKDSLSTFTRTFGPYQYSQVRIMEFPYGGFAQAFAGTIPFSENIGFVRKPGDPEDNQSVDLATYVTMHELGHQWFAHQIVPADVKGFNVLSEGLTENAALTAYEEAFGWQRTRKILEQRAIDPYLISRTLERDDEPALVNAGNQSYLHYQKPNWVFWGLKQYIGEDEMQGAIRAFLEEYGSKGPPYPTTHQLVDYLREAAGPDYQQLVTDYWERITFWDMGLNDITLSQNGGDYTVSFTAKVDKKIASEETGKETSVTEMDNENLNEWVEIGLYDKDPKDTLGDEWIKLERVKITELETDMTLTVDTKPTHIVIDPRRLLIERNYDDNIQKISDTTVTG